MKALHRISLLACWTFLSVKSFAQTPSKRAYVEPKSAGGVVSLIEDDPDPLIPLLTNRGGGEPGTATREDVDVYCGLHALRVTGMQKYEPNLPGWSFKIVEKPAADGEFRHLRFAWKKSGGTGIMVQFHDPDTGWSLRYVAGQNSMGWESTAVDAKSPADWQVVTRDLFADFKTRTISGIAFTSMDGSHGLFDHVMLGRSVADLDRKSDELLGKAAVKLTKAEFQKAWTAMLSDDRQQLGEAFGLLVRGSKDAVPFLKAELLEDSPEGAAVKKQVVALIAELDDDKFEVRDAATRKLQKIGATAKKLLVVAANTHASAEVVNRCEKLLAKLGAKPGAIAADELRAARAARILECAGTPEARLLLKELERGLSGPASAQIAKAVLARLPDPATGNAASKP